MIGYDKEQTWRILPTDRFILRSHHFLLYIQCHLESINWYNKEDIYQGIYIQLVLET